MTRYHRIDGRRGYYVPNNAVAGASDTGDCPDSPCPSGQVKAEITRFQRECLRPAGIESRTRWGSSSNVFCSKRWVCVKSSDFDKAARLALEWLKKHDCTLRYMHDADQQQVLKEPA